MRLVGEVAWMADAACRGMDAEVFFPGRGESTEPARAVCRGCPVVASCLDHALAHSEKVGVWGGTSERERRKIRSARLAAAGVAAATCVECGEQFAPGDRLARWCSKDCWLDGRAARRRAG